MNRSHLILLFIFLFGDNVCKNPEYDKAVFPKNKARLDIEDYFLILPKESFQGYEFQNSKRTDLFKRPDSFQPGTWYVTDLNKKNGEIRLGNGGAGEWASIDIMMWSLGAKEAIIVLNHTSSNLAYTETTSLVFYEFKDEEWRDVSKEIIRGPLLDNIYRKTMVDERETFIECMLPNKGYNIQCILPDEFYNHLSEEEKEKVNVVIFEWKDKKFHKKIRKATPNDYKPLEM